MTRSSLRGERFIAARRRFGRGMFRANYRSSTHGLQTNPISANGLVGGFFERTGIVNGR